MPESEIKQDNQDVQTVIAVAGNYYAGAGAVPADRAVVETAILPPRGRLSRSVPPRNLVFTGRENELERLHIGLQTGIVALTPFPQALHGSGGYGKTQTAIEYCHRHRDDYDCLLWTRGENPAQFITTMASLAPQLVPPVPTQADEAATYRAVCDWLAAHRNWLLVVDNAEQLTALQPLLPQHSAGAILLTTRETPPPTLAKRIAIERLDEESGATLLLRRAGKIENDEPLFAAPPDWQAGAKAVSKAVDGLALALDQAGAYIGERGITPTKYLEYYRQRGQNLHQTYENPAHQSVAITYSLALEQVKQIPDYGEAAAELALLCAFLAPDAIPDEIFLAGASKLDEPLAALAASEIDFAEVRAAACRYSLIRRDADAATLWMHRVAQEVLRDTLQPDEQRRRKERVVLAVNAAFPWPEYANWPLCERLLPHALHCEAHVIACEIQTHEAAYLLNSTAYYLDIRARYPVAERLFKSGLTIYRQVYGDVNENVAAAINNLVSLYLPLHRDAEAEPLLLETIEIARQTIGEQHPHYAIYLDRLATAYQGQNRYAEAEPLSRQALVIMEQAHGPEHPSVAIRVNNLAALLSATGRHAEAEPLYRRTVEISRKMLGANHPDYARNLYGLAAVLINQGRYAEAEPLLSNARTVLEAAHPGGHPHTATCLFWQGVACARQNRNVDAAAYFRRALAMRERFLPPEHPEIANTRDWLDSVEGGG